jgi:hypothetical protein
VEVGRAARGFGRDDKVDVATLDPDALSWLKRFGYVAPYPSGQGHLEDARKEVPWPSLMSLLGEKIEALLDITPDNSPVVLSTAFETRAEEGARAVFSGRGPSAQDAIEGALFEAMEVFAARLSGDALGSNGLAAGLSHEEAACAAILEIVERDAVAIWWRSGHRVPKLRLETRACRAAVLPIESWLESCGRRMALLDVTTDIGIPVVLALSTDPAGRRPLIGAGADISESEAAYKAASELVQMEVNLRYIAQNVERSGEDSLPQDVASLWTWHGTATLDNQPGLKADPDLPKVARAPLAGRDRLSQVRSCLRAAELDAEVGALSCPLEGVWVVRAKSNELMDLHRVNDRAREAPFKLGLLEDSSRDRPLTQTPIPL